MFAPAISLTASQPLLKSIRSPKRWLIGIFVVLAGLALALTGNSASAENLVMASAFAAGMDLALATVKSERWTFPDGALLTGIIVAFILRPTDPASTVIISVAVAIASKHVMRTRWSNILNPAAIALVFSGVLLSSGQSWWGALPELGIAGAVVVLALGLVITDRINKLPMVLVFLGTYFGLFTIAALSGQSAEVAGIFRAPDLHAALFFALFMLNDPPTSPVRYEDQVVYGIVVASLAYLLLMTVGVVYYLPLALLGGNAWESGRRLFADWSRKRSIA